MARRTIPALLIALSLVACGGEPPASTPVTSPDTAPVTTPVTTLVTTPVTTPVTTLVTIPVTTLVTIPVTTPVTIPETGLSAMPFQNRLDVAKNLFQVKVFNRTDEPVTVTGAQFVWPGMTTPVAERANTVAPGGRTDFPVLLVPAVCHGDGSEASMPDLTAATVRLTLADGSQRDIPVYDVKRVAQRLYLQDCERQRIAGEVQIEWTDLHEVDVDDRPVTDGYLRLARAASTSRVTVLFVSNTINFTVEWPEIAEADDARAVLEAGEQSVSVPVRFVEGRCDAHALSESSQPFQFVAIVDLGDGIERSYAVVPAAPDQIPMKQRVERACEILGKTIFVGEG